MLRVWFLQASGPARSEHDRIQRDIKPYAASPTSECRLLGAWWGGWGTTGGVHKLNHCSVQQLGAGANAARLIITHIISRRGGDIRPTAVDVCDHKARCIGARHRHHLHRTCGRFDGGGVPMCYSVRVRARARVRVRAMLSSKQKDVGEGVPPLWETAPFTRPLSRLLY